MPDVPDVCVPKNFILHFVLFHRNLRKIKKIVEFSNVEFHVDTFWQ